MGTDIDTLHHIDAVNDIKSAIDWYRARVAAEELYSYDTWALLHFDNIAPALMLSCEQPPHFAVERANATPFSPLTSHRDETASGYIEDPWGNSVEIIECNSSGQS